ncbi:MAG: hypothetical protein HS115_16320 [Spirochaetales bacterium]|nr:hypothetical protein [Spirochaetales bacterium]
MSYMAVGSRQILFSDAAAPSGHSTANEITAVQDNSVAEVPSSVPPEGQNRPINSAESESQIDILA